MTSFTLNPIGAIHQGPKQDACEELKGSKIILTQDFFHRFLEAREIPPVDGPAINWAEKAVIALSLHEGLPCVAELTDKQRVEIHTRESAHRPTVTTWLYEVPRGRVQGRSLIFNLSDLSALTRRIGMEEIGEYTSICSASDFPIPRRAPIPFEPIGYLNCRRDLVAPPSPWLVGSEKDLEQLVTMLAQPDDLREFLGQSLKTYDILAIHREGHSQFRIPFVSSILPLDAGLAQITCKALPTRFKPPTIAPAGSFGKPSPRLLLVRVAKGSLKDMNLSFATSTVREEDGNVHRLKTLQDSAIYGCETERVTPEGGQRFLEEAWEFYERRPQLVTELTGPYTPQAFGRWGTSREQIYYECGIRPDLLMPLSK